MANIYWSVDDLMTTVIKKNKNKKKIPRDQTHEHWLMENPNHVI